MTTITPKVKAKRGFGAMSQEKQKEIASKGGVAAHKKGTAHIFTPEEAREAGRKGGQAAQLARLTNKKVETAPTSAHRVRAGTHRVGTSWLIGNAVILGNDPETCNHIYPRTRAGNCQGCGSTEGQYPGPPAGDSP